jgi:hypothetical protein
MNTTTIVPIAVLVSCVECAGCGRECHRIPGIIRSVRDVYPPHVAIDPPLHYTHVADGGYLPEGWREKNTLTTERDATTGDAILVPSSLALCPDCGPGFEMTMGFWLEERKKAMGARPAHLSAVLQMIERQVADAAATAEIYSMAQCALTARSRATTVQARAQALLDYARERLVRRDGDHEDRVIAIAALCKAADLPVRVVAERLSQMSHFHLLVQVRAEDGEWVSLSDAVFSP